MLAQALVGYLILQFGIAFIASRTIKVEADYFVAGRKLGVYAVAMSVFATWFGAESVMGSSGAVAAEGLAGGRADPFGYTICLLAMATFIAFKMREAGVITFVDFFRERFGRTANWFAALLTIPTSIIWASAQLLAMGQIVGEVTGLETNIGLLIGATVIIVYTTVGGLLGDVITDIVQGTILIVSLLILLVVVLVSHQFPLDQIKPEQLTLIALGDDGQPQSLLATLDAWMVPILGSLVAQEAISRFLGARTPSVARMGCYWAAGIYLVIGSVPVLLGLLGTAVGFPGHGSGSLPAAARQPVPRSDHVCRADGRDRLRDPFDRRHDAARRLRHRHPQHRGALVPNLIERGKVRVGRALTAVRGSSPWRSPLPGRASRTLSRSRRPLARPESWSRCCSACTLNSATNAQRSQLSPLAALSAFSATASSQPWLSWFIGGMRPANSPDLDRASKAATSSRSSARWSPISASRTSREAEPASCRGP